MDLCVSHVPIFRRLDREEQEAVAELAKPVRVAAGEAIYTQGARNAPLIVLHQGSVKLTRVTRDGRERVVGVLSPGDFTGEAALLTGARPDHSAVAVEDTVACSFLREDFATLLAQHPEIGFTMMSALSQRLADSHDMLEQVTSRDVSARVADYLLGLEAQRGSGGVQVRLPLPKKDIASLLGTTPESFSRTLAKLVDDDVIVLEGPRTITIVDVEGLSTLADG